MFPTQTTGWPSYINRDGAGEKGTDKYSTFFFLILWGVFVCVCMYSSVHVCWCDFTCVHMHIKVKGNFNHRSSGTVHFTCLELTK